MKEFIVLLMILYKNHYVKNVIKNMFYLNDEINDMVFFALFLVQEIMLILKKNKKKVI